MREQEKERARGQDKDSEERRRDEGVDGLPWKVREQLKKSEVSPQEEEYSTECSKNKMLNRDLGKATCLIKRFEETANQLKAKLDGQLQQLAAEEKDTEPCY